MTKVVLHKDGTLVSTDEEILPNATDINIFYSDGARALPFNLTL